MMEFGSLQNGERARHTEKMFGQEGRSPSIDTGLPLGAPGGGNKGASILPQDMGRFPSVSNMPVLLPSTSMGGYTSTLSGSLVENEAVPMPSFCQVTGIKTVTKSPPGTIDSNQTTYTSPPDSGLSPPIPSAAILTTPIMSQNLLVEPSPPNVGSAKEIDKGVLRDGSNGNNVIPPIAVPVDTEGTRVRVDIDNHCMEIDNHQLNMATQPGYLGESQSSQADFNNICNRGDTQLVHDNQVGLDDTQPPVSGDTQLVNDPEGFDDMVILQDSTLTASAILLTNAGQSVSLELMQGTYAQPLQDSFDVPASTRTGNIFNNGIPASYESEPSTGERETYATADGPNARVSVMQMPPVEEHPEVHPAETAGQLGLTEGKEKDMNTPEPQLALLDENVNDKGKADEGMMAQDGEAETGVKDDVTGKAKVVSEQDIQAIKGRKVVKKFGRKNYVGEVVDYDAENQWFKVVYEDGDEEDLELSEVKEILCTEDTPSNASTSKRKRSHPEGVANDQLARKRKRTPKKKGAVARAQKKMKPQQVKSPPGSKTKGVKRKRSPDVNAMTSGKLEMEDIGGKMKSRGNKQSGNAKTQRKSSAKLGGKGRPKNSANKKGKLLAEESKVEKASEAGEGEKGGKFKGKRGKSNASEDQNDAPEDQGTLVGKSVKKNFDGTLYAGVVVKFDKVTKYYEVKYEDGDEEEMELEELKAVLVQ